MITSSVFGMVQQVLGEAKEKTAQSSKTKTAAPTQEATQAVVADGGETLSKEYLSKLASACDHLANNVHLIDDNRTPQEKLAEMVALNQALLQEKTAFEGGDKAHQHTEAKPAFQSPHTVSLDGSGTGVGKNNAIPSMQNNAPGTSLEPGESGEATSGHQSPKTTGPTVKPYPADKTPTAMTTNDKSPHEHTKQPANLLKQEGGASKHASVDRAQSIVDKVSGKTQRSLQEKVAAEKRARVLMLKAAQSGIPADAAARMLGFDKAAEDALNPAHISAGTTPELQTDPGTPSQLSQGSEAGTNTPRETAPSSGEGGGRDLLASNESAINATKREAKKQNLGAISQVLTEPAMSAEHDKTLNESLQNTSSAGVKIAAARELLKKLASSNPQFAAKLAALAKQAEGEETKPEQPAGGPPQKAETQAPAPQVAAPAPEGEMDPAMMDGGGEMPMPSEAAIAAVHAGVTPEELLMAEEMLSQELGGGTSEVPPPGGEVADVPAAGAESPEKQQMMGASPMASSSPSSMM